jgi:hypothetical protein
VSFAAAKMEDDAPPAAPWLPELAKAIAIACASAVATGMTTAAIEWCRERHKPPTQETKP